MCVALCAAGCAGPAETADDSRWSTKELSEAGRSAAMPLEVESPPRGGDFAQNVRAQAMGVLEQALESSNPLLRANAIEALHPVPGQIEEAVRRGLGDENRGVRFVAAMTVAELELAGLAWLVEPLLRDPSTSVRAAAMCALERSGRSVDLTPLAGMIASDDPETRGNAALVLGELGDPSALKMLRQVLGRPLPGATPEQARIVDMQIAEAMVRLGDKDQLEGLRAALFAPPEQGEVVALACQMLGRLEDQGVRRNLLDLATRTGRRQQAPEIRLAAVAALAEIDPALAPAGVALELAGSDRFSVRAHAALTLGALGRSGHLSTLAVLLNDDNPLVQVSAAAAILQVQVGSELAKTPS